MTFTMYDSIDISQIPADAAVVAGYTSGNWPTFAELAARFPHARRVSIAVTASADADFLDIEAGDASVAQAAGWYARQRARGATCPGFYASAGVMATDLIPSYQAAGITRRAVRLWSAHYDAGAHICGPSTCGLVPFTVDGTQYTSNALGRNLDASLLAASFFTGASPSPVPNWQEAMMSALPQLKQGATGDAVRTVQGLLPARGYPVSLDGVFGPATNETVRQFQAHRGLSVDGIIGPATWAALVGTA